MPCCFLEVPRPRGTADTNGRDDMREPTGLPAVVDTEPGPGDSLVLRALRSHAARCTPCRDVALCEDGRTLVQALQPTAIRGVRVDHQTWEGVG